jgi:hypothetical protein
MADAVAASGGDGRGGAPLCAGADAEVAAGGALAAALALPAVGAAVPLRWLGRLFRTALA